MADLIRAIDLLTRSRDGFGSLGARWEAALAALWLAEALGATERTEDARSNAEAALVVFDELGSVLERDRARALL